MLEDGVERMNYKHQETEVTSEKGWKQRGKS